MLYNIFDFLFFLFKGLGGKVIGNNVLTEMASLSNVQHKNIVNKSLTSKRRIFFLSYLKGMHTLTGITNLNQDLFSFEEAIVGIFCILFVYFRSLPKNHFL